MSFFKSQECVVQQCSIQSLARELDRKSDSVRLLQVVAVPFRVVGVRLLQVVAILLLLSQLAVFSVQSVGNTVRGDMAAHKELMLGPDLTPLQRRGLREGGLLEAPFEAPSKGGGVLLFL